MIQLALDPHQWAVLLAVFQGVLTLLNPPRTADPFPAEVPALHLTYTYKDGALDVPPPAVVPDGFWKTPLARDWADVGDVRPAMKFVDADDTRYEIDGLGFFEEDGKRRPMFSGVRRFRGDGTLEVETRVIGMDGGKPVDWTAYAADGKTPVLRVLARDRGFEELRDNILIPEPTYYVASILTYDDAGRHAVGDAATAYNVNYDGTIFIRYAVEFVDGGGWTHGQKLEGEYGEKQVPRLLPVP